MEEIKESGTRRIRYRIKKKIPARRRRRGTGSALAVLISAAALLVALACWRPEIALRLDSGLSEASRFFGGGDIAVFEAVGGYAAELSQRAGEYIETFAGSFAEGGAAES